MVGQTSTKPEQALRAPGLIISGGLRRNQPYLAKQTGQARMPVLQSVAHEKTTHCSLATDHCPGCRASPYLARQTQTGMSMLQSAAHEDIRPPALITGPACREIVHVHSGAVHVFRTRGWVCEGEIVYVYEYVNEYDYAIMQPNPSRRSGLPGSSSAAVCGETSPTFSARDTDRNVYVAVCGA
jgi:hypothetical protein